MRDARIAPVMIGNFHEGDHLAAPEWAIWAPVQGGDGAVWTGCVACQAVLPSGVDAVLAEQACSRCTSPLKRSARPETRGQVGGLPPVPASGLVGEQLPFVVA